MILKEKSLAVAMDLAKTVEGEDQLFKALSIMDPMVVDLVVTGLQILQMVAVKSPSLDSNNKSRSSNFPRTLTMTSKQRSTSLELVQTTRTVLIGLKSKRCLGPFSVTQQPNSSQVTKCPNGATLKRMN
jgi:hypothetical protein